MTRFLQWWVALLLAGAALPATLRADWVVADYDNRTDWVNYDFVGWVRVEYALKAKVYSRGNAAVLLTVVERLAGNATAPSLALEFTAPNPNPKGDGSDPPETRNWEADIPGHGQFLVFLTRLPNGGFWCDDLRAFPIVDGVIAGLPKAYQAVLGEDVAPVARDFFIRARGTVPALRAKVGRPDFNPPLIESGKPAVTPREGFAEVQTALRAGNARELDRLILSLDNSAPRGLRAHLLEQKDRLVAGTVRWQAVLDDKAIVQVAAPGETDGLSGTFYLVRRGVRWQVLNTLPDSPGGRQRVTDLLTENQFTVLNALLAREFPQAQ